jgi:hypothetical protein
LPQLRGAGRTVGSAGNRARANRFAGPRALAFERSAPQAERRFSRAAIPLEIFVKWLFAIPHLFVLSFFGMLVSILVWIAWFVILLTRHYPESMFGLIVTYMRWTANVNVFIMFQRDEYPPFGAGPYPVHLELAYPAELSRWLIFIKWLLVIPNLLVYFFVGLALLLALFIAWWVILITGRMPRGLFDFITGVNRWGHRLNAYTWLMTDKYPPFSLE